jgi:hypothetical protein
MRRLFGLLVSVAVAGAFGVGLLASQALGAGPTLSVPDVSQNLSERVTVNFRASDFGEPGLGAWTIDLVYDSTQVTAISCSSAANLSVCNADYSDHSVRLAGASAQGLTGDFAIASIVFECRDRAGMSPLTITPKDIYDATPAHLQRIEPALDHGSITCAVSGRLPTHMPEAGSGGGPIDGKLALALVGLLGMMSIMAVSRAVPYLRRRAG